MSAFSSAAGGGHSIFGWSGREQPLSRQSSMSSLSTESNNIVTLTPNGRVISISGKQEFEENSIESDFATHTNALSAALQHVTQDIIEKEYNEDDAATELSTGFTKLDDEAGGSQTIKKIEDAIKNYKIAIDEIAKTTFDAPSPASSQDTVMTQNSESTKSELSVLQELIKPEMTMKLVTPVLTKKKLAPELVDITFTKCFYKASSVEEILAKNNQFGILKFACANDIPINGRIEKLFYFVKELEWMLEQGESNKNTTRKLRFDVLSACTNNVSALHLFNIIYKMLCKSADGAFIKICAVGGNVLRAFFLALRWARNVSNGVANPETCAAFNKEYGWTPNDAAELGQFAASFGGALDTLCEKSSDTDFTVIKKMTPYDTLMEQALNALCVPLSERPTCNGQIEFPLIRMKTPIFEDGQYYAEKCNGYIQNSIYVMNAAKKYFSDIMWFAQGIPDYPVEQLDVMYGEKLKSNPKLSEIYPEIRKLFCTLQQVKKHNAALTSLNSDVISQGSFTHLMLFTTTCCEIFFNTISQVVTAEHDLQDIKQIVEIITPPASRAIFDILTNPITEQTIINVLQRIKDANYLASTEFSEKYNTNIQVLFDATGGQMPVTSSCIAVSSSVEGVSEIHKMSSAGVRGLFKDNKELNPLFGNNIVISINCLQFERSSLSIEDLKEAGEQPAVEIQKLSIESNLPKTKSRKMKDVKPEKKKEKTVEELKSIIKKYNEGKPPKDRIKGFTSMTRSQLTREIASHQIIFKGGAKTRKQKPRKTRKIRKGAIA